MADMGVMSSETWELDPRRLGFVLARYKFVAKMFRGFHSVLEVGCADAFGTRVVCQEVKRLLAVDVNPKYVRSATDSASYRWPVEFRQHDMLSGPVPGDFRGAYSLDVLEHVDPADEVYFIRNIANSLTQDGVLIIGTPSIQSQVYASELSKAGHVNCQDEPMLRELLGEYFANVFIFGMNDEVLHTGFSPMCHYLFAMGTNKR